MGIRKLCNKLLIAPDLKLILQKGNLSRQKVLGTWESEVIYDTIYFLVRLILFKLSSNFKLTLAGIAHRFKVNSGTNKSPSIL